jgi:hypothetical protein
MPLESKGFHSRTGIKEFSHVLLERDAARLRKLSSLHNIVAMKG